MGAEAKTVVPQLILLLKDSDAKVRSRADYALARMRAEVKTALQQLIPLLQDSDVTVRSSAANALGSIGAEAKTGLPQLQIRPLAKKIYVIIRGFKFNPLKLTHNCKLLTTNYNADHNGDGDSDNDSTIF